MRATIQVESYLMDHEHDQIVLENASLQYKRDARTNTCKLNQTNYDELYRMPCVPTSRALGSFSVEQDNLEWRTFNLLLVGNYSFFYFFFIRFVPLPHCELALRPSIPPIRIFLSLSFSLVRPAYTILLLLFEFGIWQSSSTLDSCVWDTLYACLCINSVCY